MFSNDIRVGNTINPSVNSLPANPNVGQYGWTKVESGYYNQLIEYVEEVRKNAEYVEQVAAYVSEVYEKVQGVEDFYNRTKQYYDQTKVMYDDFLNKYGIFNNTIQNFNTNYSDFTNKYDTFNTNLSDFRDKYLDVLAKHTEVTNLRDETKGYRDEVVDIAEELKKGQVYRGLWNPTTNAYPATPDTNSVWDVVLPDGIIEHTWNGEVWRNGDRLLYLKDTGQWQHQASGSSVFSVNGKTGAVQLTATDVKALPITGGELTGNASVVGTITVKAPANHITLVETDNANKTWSAEVQSGDLRIKEGNTIRATYDDAGGFTVTGDVTTDGSFVSSKAPTNANHMTNKTYVDKQVTDINAKLEDIVGGAIPSETAPPNPKQGVSWYNTLDGKTYIWYEDVDSGQWVEQSPDKIVQDPSFGGVPLMSVMWFSSRSSIGLGFVAADGQILSDHLYPDASKEVVAGKVPTVSEATWESTPAQRGKYVKTADGFRVPDLNGVRSGSLGAVFLRGDGSRSAGTNGLIQEDQIQNITGSLRATPTYGLTTPSSPTGAFYAGETLTGNLAGQVGGADDDTANRRVANFDASRVARTGTETRPLNVTGVWAIKVFGAVVNQGEMDAAELSASLEEAKLEIATLKDKVASLENYSQAITYLQNNASLGEAFFSKVGRVVTFRAFSMQPGAWPNSTVLFDIPEGFKPVDWMVGGEFMANRQDNGESGRLICNKNSLYAYNMSVSTGYFRVTGSWICD